MGIGTSLLLIAVGAVLKFAVSANTSGINLQTVGVILMIVGGVGLILTLLWFVNSRDRYPDGVERRTTTRTYNGPGPDAPL